MDDLKKLFTTLLIVVGLLAVIAFLSVAVPVGSIVYKTIAAAIMAPSPKPTDWDLVAADGHFLIGGQHIVIPIGSIRMSGQGAQTFSLAPAKRVNWHEVMKEKALDPAHPMEISEARIHPLYSLPGEIAEGQRVCEALKRPWARNLCFGRKEGRLKDLPIYYFDIILASNRDRLKQHTLSGFSQPLETLITPTPGLSTGTYYDCTRPPGFCQASIEVLPGVIAYWSAGPKPGDYLKAQAQGEAVRELLLRGMAPEPDPTF